MNINFNNIKNPMGPLYTFTDPMSRNAHQMIWLHNKILDFCIIIASFIGLMLIIILLAIHFIYTTIWEILKRNYEK